MPFTMEEIARVRNKYIIFRELDSHVNGGACSFSSTENVALETLTDDE